MKRFSALAFAASFACVTAAAAADGDIDTTFGVNGIARANLINTSNTLNGGPVVQPDGKFVICNGVTDNGPSGPDFYVARFTAGGELDPDFSFDGSVTIDFDGGVGGDQCSAVALQSDGKIVVAGFTVGATPSTQDFAIARLDADGTLDTTFGNGTGKTTVGFDLPGGGADTATSVAIQADGKIVVAGVAASANGSQFAVVRLNTDGARDSAFNLTGRVTFGLGISGANPEQDTAYNVAIDSANRILLGGSAAYNDGTNNISDFAAARLMPNGQFDANFHANGRTTVPFDPGNGISNVIGYGMLLQHDGKLLLIGGANSSPSTPNTDSAVARLLPDGSLDGGFGTGGRVLIPFDTEPNGQDLMIGGVEQSNGGLVFVGGAFATSTNVTIATAARLHADGTLDDTFGNAGRKTYDFAFGGVNDQQLFRNVALQGAQLIATGIAYVPGGIDLYSTRLDIDLIFADGFD